MVGDGDAELPIGVARQYFETRIGLPAGNGGLASGPAFVLVHVGLHHHMRLHRRAIIEQHASYAPVANLGGGLKGWPLDMKNSCVCLAILVHSLIFFYLVGLRQLADG